MIYMICPHVSFVFSNYLSARSYQASIRRAKYHRIAGSDPSLATCLLVLLMMGNGPIVLLAVLVGARRRVGMDFMVLVSVFVLGWLWLLLVVMLVPVLVSVVRLLRYRRRNVGVRALAPHDRRR